MKSLKLIAAAGLFLAGVAAVGCSGGYSGPTGPDTTKKVTSRAVLPHATVQQLALLAE